MMKTESKREKFAEQVVKELLPKGFVFKLDSLYYKYTIIVRQIRNDPDGHNYALIAGNKTIKVTEPFALINEMNEFARLDDWDLVSTEIEFAEPTKPENPPKEKKKVIKVELSQSMEKAISEKDGIYYYTLRRNLAIVMEKIRNMQFESIYDFMYKFDEAMMMLAGIAISYEASHYDPNTWLVLTTNDYFISESGFTGIRVTITPKEYYEDEIAEFSYGQSRMIL